MGSFYDYMISKLVVNAEKLSQKMLQGYVGGQVQMYHNSTRDRSMGKIDQIDFIAGAIEVSCEWMAHMKRKGRKWRSTNREPFLILYLQYGWGRYKAGAIIIEGENGNMLLLPAGHEDSITEPIES